MDRLMKENELVDWLFFTTLTVTGAVQIIAGNPAWVGYVWVAFGALGLLLLIYREYQIRLINKLSSPQPSIPQPGADEQKE